MRKIIHVDMDCFYAAVEMRDFPLALANKPVAVGKPSRRGVLTTCNYEARKFGCRSAMPTWKAIELCPTLIVVAPRFEVYREEAQHIREIFKSYTSLIEPLSLDEAYLDVTHSERFAWDIAKEIRARILKERRLTASAGIAPNKLLAKIASDWKKPNGQFAVRPEEIDDFIKGLPVQKLWGIGPKSNEKLLAMGIRSCADLQKLSLHELDKAFGNSAHSLYRQCRGIDERPVVSERVRKSLSTERTLEEAIDNENQALDLAQRLGEELIEEVREKNLSANVAKIFVRLKFDDFQKTSHECLATHAHADDFKRLLAIAWARRGSRRARLIGVGVRFHQLETLDDSQLALPF